MSNRLKDFINENREDFDNEIPSSMIWKNIEKDLPVEQKKTPAPVFSMKRFAAAAAVLIALSAGAYFIIYKTTGRVDVTSANTPGANIATDTQSQKQLLDEINPTYAKEVYHFTQLIELKQNELKQIEKDQPELYKQFMQDITHLDSSYNVLQKELSANPNREQLLEAMIQNLQLQTELLNQQLRVIKQIKQSKTGSNESNSKII